MGLKSEDYTAQLQAILRIAHGIREVAAVSLPPNYSPSVPSHEPAVIDSIRLPSPRPLLPSLLEAGISSEVASAACQIYQRRSEQLKQRIQESIATACRTVAEFPAHTSLPPDLFMKRVTSIFADVYFSRLREWKEEIIQRIKHASEIPAKEVLRDSRTFNQEYVPLLEHFFEENPFPTRADKLFLAKKSNMQYRQIHVWFQNRRNRTKKEGKALRKKPTYEGATKPLDELYERMKGHMVESDSQVPKSSKLGSSEGAAKIESARNNVPKDTFASSSPPHAFPSVYPPTCHYDPFPCKSGPFHFSRPEWRGAPCGKLPLPLSTSVDELVERFSQLNVRDETRSKGSPKLQLHAATAAITVVPSRAPHPSLIVSKYHQPTNIVQRHPLVRAPVSASKVFQSRSPALKPVTLVPSSAYKNELPGKRKTASLPRRFPGRVRNNRDTTPSGSSPTSSYSPRLFSPDSESRSCSFSSVSSLSTPSDMASTQELPYSFGSPCCSPFDSPIHLCNLGHIAPIIPSSVS